MDGVWVEPRDISSPLWRWNLSASNSWALENLFHRHLSRCVVVTQTARCVLSSQLCELCDHIHVCVPVRWLHHRPRSAFNEGDGMKINIVPLKWFHIIPLLPLISIYLLCGWKCTEAQTERNLSHYTPVSTLVRLPLCLRSALTAATQSELCFRNVRITAWSTNTDPKQYVSFLNESMGKHSQTFEYTSL